MSTATADNYHHRGRIGCLSIFAMAFVGVILWIFLATPKGNPTKSPPSKPAISTSLNEPGSIRVARPMPGQTGILTGSHLTYRGDPLIVLIDPNDEEAWSIFEHATRHGDGAMMMRLVGEERASFQNAGTRIRVEKIAIGRMTVRTEDGTVGITTSENVMRQ